MNRKQTLGSTALISFTLSHAFLEGLVAFSAKTHRHISYVFDTEADMDGRTENRPTHCIIVSTIGPSG